jgi:hypothetical protein
LNEFPDEVGEDFQLIFLDKLALGIVQQFLVVQTIAGWRKRVLNYLPLRSPESSRQPDRFASEPISISDKTILPLFIINTTQS